MGNTGGRYGSRRPTDECYKLAKPISSSEGDGTKTKEISKEKSIEIINHVSLTNEISIRYNTSERSDLKICMYDVTGREILSQTVKNISSGLHTITIDKNLKNGIYFLRVEAGLTVEKAKVILIR